MLSKVNKKALKVTLFFAITQIVFKILKTVWIKLIMKSKSVFTIKIRQTNSLQFASLNATFFFSTAKASHNDIIYIYFVHYKQMNKPTLVYILYI